MLDIREMELNMGPQHPSTHGVLRLILYLDGETVVDCKPVMGYLHRGTEKLCETRDYYQNVPFTDRTDYLAAPYMNLGYVEAVEKLADGRQAAENRGLLAEARELQRKARDLAGTTSDYETDPSKLLHLREELGGLLDCLEKELPGSIGRDVGRPT